MESEIIIVGIGRNTGVTVELAELCGFAVKGLLHYDVELTNTEKWGYSVLGQTDDFISNNISRMNFALSIGDNKVRTENYQKIIRKGGRFPTLIHPTATVSRFAAIKEGVQVHANSTIQADVSIGSNTIISFGVGITHSVIIDENCYVAGHSIVGAYTQIGKNVFIGMGSTIISGKVPEIGNNAIIGAGSLVTKRVRENSNIFGRPAK